MVSCFFSKVVGLSKMCQSIGGESDSCFRIEMLFMGDSGG